MLPGEEQKTAEKKRRGKITPAGIPKCGMGLGNTPMKLQVCSKTDEKENRFKNQGNMENQRIFSIVTPMNKGNQGKRKWIFTKSLPAIVKFYKKGIDKCGEWVYA